MEDNPYNRKIAEQLKAINDLYLVHLKKTGKEVVDSDRIPLVKPNIHYEANGFFDDMVSGLSTGFAMPLQLVNKVLGGKKKGGLIKIAKGAKANYGETSKPVVSGNVGIARAVGSGNAEMEGSGIFDDIGEFVGNVKNVLPLAALVGIGKKKSSIDNRPRKAGSVGVQAMAENKNALTGGKKRGRPSKKKMEAGGPLSGLLGAIGLGEEMAGEEMAGGKKRGRPSKKKMEAGGPLSGLLGAIGLGEEMAGGKKRGRSSKKKMEAAGIFDDILSTVGKVVKTTADVAPDAVKLIKMVKGGAKKSSRWIDHVKAYSKKHNMKYSECLKDAKCKSSYKK
jgi:hypothetical protein